MGKKNINYPYARFYIGEFAKRILCICPKCSKKHYRKIEWTGKGNPRILCKNCLDILSK